MNLNISRLVHFEVRTNEIMPETIEENTHKSLGLALTRLSPQANQLRMMECIHLFQLRLLLRRMMRGPCFIARGALL